MQKQLVLIGFMVLFGPAMKVCNAQNNINWELMTLNANDGTNKVMGVEGYCALTTCNGSPRVMLMLVNKNNYTVKACWKDFVLTKTDEQRHPGANAQDSVIIGANSQVRGDCAENNPHLVLNLSDFGTDADDFSGIITTNFDYVIIH